MPGCPAETSVCVKTWCVFPLLLSAHRIVEACSVCTAIGGYDFLRFGVVWFYLLPLITATMVAADLRRQPTEPENSARWLHSKPFLIVTFVLIPILGLMGAHFLVLLAIPYLLWPYVFGPRRVSNEVRQSRAEQAPMWLRRTSQGFGALLLISMIASYGAFPLMLGESQTRAMVSRARSDMRTVAGWLNDSQSGSDSFPPALQIQDEGTTFSTLDPASLAKYERMEAEEIAKRLNDPFLYDLGEAGALTEFAVFFPIVWLDWKTARFRPDRFDRMQYFQDSGGYLLQSRGPDGAFEDGLHRAILQAQPDNRSAIGAAANLTYDPTNGTVSRGDIWRRGLRGGRSQTGDQWFEAQQKWIRE